MNGCYVWQEQSEGKRRLFKGYLKEEEFKWVAKIIDNEGQELWREEFASPQKARAALVRRVPDEARFMEGVRPE